MCNSRRPQTQQPNLWSARGLATGFEHPPSILALQFPPAADAEAEAEERQWDGQEREAGHRAAVNA